MGNEVVEGSRALAAPAKVNLGLRIVGRRDDGYHLLESVFAPIDLVDDVVVRVAPARRSSVSLAVEIAADAPAAFADVPSDARNLAHRAASGFLAVRAEADPGAPPVEVRIELTKRVPAGAGLGGGSSDAGAVLRALAELAPGALAEDALADLAVSLGADVPFFLDPRPALVEGIGERIARLEALPRLDLILAGPGQPLSTPSVFSATAALSPNSYEERRGEVARALEAFVEAGTARVAELLRNDLEAAANRLCPPVSRLQRTLRAAGAVATAMSGSGATVFGVFADEAEARDALARVRVEPPAWVRLAATTAAG